MINISNVYIMCGLPGIGKSTWITNFKSCNKVVISRDAIRFSILTKEDEYFSREDDVFYLFIREIRAHLASQNNLDIFIDATHLNKNSRKKLFNAIGKNRLDKHNIIAVVFPNDLDKALKQNELRKGQGRAYVPRGVIRRMHEQFEFPTLEEGFNKIIEVK